MRRLSAAVLASLLAASCGPSSTPAAPSPPIAPGPAVAAPPAPSAAPSARPSDALGERSTDGAGVEVKATWVAIDPPALRVTMDTHSVNLDVFDLAKLARIRVDGGSWVGPTAVDMPKGGHHREGSLQFATLTSAFGTARVIELEIAEVAVPTRSFRWER